MRVVLLYTSVPEIVFPRQGEQCPVVIISYMGYSSPKFICHGKQSHSSKYMILLECLHTQSHVSSPHRLPHTCLSQMRVKYSFQNKSFLFLKTSYRVSVNILDYPPRRIAGSFFRNSHGSTSEMKGPLSKAILRKIFLEIPFIIVFIFLFFSFMPCTHTYHLGCPSAYGMHYVNSKQFMLIYFTCIY